MKRSIIFIIVLVLLAGLAGGLGYFQFIVKPEMIKGFITKSPRPVSVVAAEEARTETWQSKLPAIGTFKAVQGIDAAPQIGGIIRAIRFESGQDVAKGAPLVEIDDSVEQADLKSGLASLKNAELALERQRQLSAGGSTAKATVDAAQAARDQAAAGVERTRANIAQKALAAPFAGRLGIRKIDVGQYVSPGLSIVTLQQLDPIFVDFPVPEQSIELLKTGQGLEVLVDSRPGKLSRGVIKTIDARVSPETRNVLVRAEVENKDKQLLPGMFANVAVLAGEPVARVTVPRTAVTFSLYGDSIYVVKQAEAGKDDKLIAERRFVRTGDAREDRIAIVEGLKAGERVVIGGQVKLQPNAPVKVDASATLTAPAKRAKE